jgi:hypothetical protein
MKSQKIFGWMGIGIVLSLALAGLLAGQEGLLWSAFGVITAGFLYLWGQRVLFLWRKFREGDCSLFVFIPRILGLETGLTLYIFISFWLLRPDLLPQRIYYDLIENRHVTERMIDPTLMKVERWDILGEERDVIFVHPTPVGSTALVYPVKIEPKTSLRVALALAPQAWKSEGDGVTFSIFVEDEAGFHLMYSQYIDPKHQQQDRRWLPVEVSLGAFKDKLVRLILVVNNGPAGDGRYDWAGWGEPRLEKPGWP